jgi:cystathionine gamma-synthase
VTGGVLSGSRAIIEPLGKLRRLLGGVLDPQPAYALGRGLKTLSLRMSRHNSNALAVAEALEGHPRLLRVYYPGLASHPDHDIARAQMSGFGGVVSFEVRGTLETASKFVDALRLPYIAPSLGGTESLVEQPTVISYWDQTPEQRAELGIRDNLIRYSCGIEDAADLIADAEQALERI